MLCDILDTPNLGGTRLRDYELVVIIKPSVTEDELQTVVTKTSQYITERGGSIGEVNQWGRKKLAYPIKEFAEGNYVHTQFSMDPQSTTELEANLELSEDILRYLLVRLSA
jgi:small subunit ribosomal protein S6